MKTTLLTFCAALAMALGVSLALAQDKTEPKAEAPKTETKPEAKPEAEKPAGKDAAKEEVKEDVAEEAAPDVATIDKKAPDFTLKNAEGKEVKLSSFLGKIVVLEWTNYDCPFVKKHYAKSGNMPKLQKEQRQAGVVWLSICSSAKGKQGNFEGEALLARIKKENADPAFYLVDDTSKVGRTYKAATTPHMFVIDAKGVLRYQGAIDSIASGKPEDIEKATNYVTEAIKALHDGKEVATKETKSYGCDTSSKFAAAN